MQHGLGGFYLVGGFTIVIGTKWPGSTGDTSIRTLEKGPRTRRIASRRVILIDGLVTRLAKNEPAEFSCRSVFAEDDEPKFTY